MATRIRQIIDACKPYRARSETVVLATIIETLGSSYQKAGARMLITAGGECHGLLGGGCFEEDLKAKAGAVFRDGRARLVFYDMRSPADAIWGLGMGCNGALRILLQAVSARDDYRPLSLIEDCLRANRTGVLATVYESTDPDFPAGSALLLDGAELDAETAVPSCPAFLAAPARTVLRGGRPLTETHHQDGHEWKVFYDPVKPPLHLLIIGAGPDAAPLARLAWELGWRVTVADHRPAFLEAGWLSGVDQRLQCHPEELAGAVALNQVQALVLMTHHIEFDERFLKVIAASTIPYVGLLCSASRRERLLESLGTDAGRLQGRLYGPVGLDIGAETPEEIALSIVAAIQAFMQRRDGGHLCKPAPATHQREAKAGS